SGTTGESPTLSTDEKLACLETVLEAVGDRAAVVFGAGTYDTRESVKLALEGEARGAHGTMLVNPYYSKPGQRGLVEHFRTVARAIGGPVLLYNIQPRSAINLETPGLLELAQEPNIVAVKEASGMLGQISEVIRQAPEGFRVYSGDDALTLPILALGGYGVVSVTGQAVGALTKRMIEVFPTDPRGAAAIHHELAPFTAACFSSPNPAPIKYAMAKLGFATLDVRLPLVPLTEWERLPIDGAMQPSWRVSEEAPEAVEAAGVA
ncbi:4-hydroxy-tetrahydrodipicolinate synthase, partial [bacterium]